MITSCDIPLDKIPFEFFGLCLQDPMGFLLNIIMSLICLSCFLFFKNESENFYRDWATFFLLFSLSTLFGGLGHLLFFYFGVYGQIPTWIFAILANYYPGRAMLQSQLLERKLKNRLANFLRIKIFLFMGLMLFVALIFGKNSFVFVMADSVLTFLIYCFGIGIYYIKRGLLRHHGIVTGVLMLFPSIFIFIFKLDVALWLNKNDLSHIFMIFTLILFYFGVKGGFKKVEY